MLRYLPAEILATVTALAGAFVGHHVSGSLIVAALTGTIGESIGYYGYFVVTGVLAHYRGHAHHPPLRRAVLVAGKTLRDLLVEFGAAELLDSLLVRPFCMYMGPRLLGNFGVGILLGKVAADVVFYACAIVGYELKKRYIPTPSDKDKTP